VPAAAAGPSLDSSGSDLFLIRPGHESGAATQHHVSIDGPPFGEDMYCMLAVSKRRIQGTERGVCVPWTVDLGSWAVLRRESR
jgi:hypothetical protein